ncbi:MAG TPA: ABC transporter ATP-binding protein, partial [Anaerohalosphaeraceae bacterium]|nr:ABC transporter ATP-binding protein [Anaerohalosphaeraceae bacterium]
NLEAGYGPLRILKGVSLHVKQGEAAAILGANGSGKTTLLKTIAGILKPRCGDIVFRGQKINSQSPEKIVEKGGAMVPEGRHVFSALTVKENLMLGAYTRYGKNNREEVAQTLEQVYSLFGILRERHLQLAGTLSGGQQQMLAIGRALMSGPKLLMMDEPSLGAAPLVIRDIYQAVEGLKRNGLTILLIEQNARAALAVADRAYVLETGQIVVEGTSEELRHNPEVQRAYLGKEYQSIDE